MKSFFQSSNKYIFAILFIIAFIIRLTAVLYFRFDGFYGQDAYAYSDFTQQFYNSIINFKLPPNLYWPMGFYAFTSVTSVFTGSSIDLAGLLLSMNAGALAAGFMFLLSIELFHNIYNDKKAKKISFFSGLITCFSGAVLKSSIVVMSDALGLLLITLCAFYLIKYINCNKRVHLVLCFVFFSLGTMTRYTTVLFLIVILTVFIYTVNKSENKSKQIYDIVISALIGLIIYSPQLCYNIYYGVSYLKFEGSAPTWAASWSPMNFFQKDFFTFDGTQHYRLWNGLFNISPVFHPMFISVFGFAFLAGLYFSVRKKKNLIIISCLCWIVVYYLYLSGNPFQSIRYTLSFFPPLVFLTAYGLGELKIKKLYKSAYIITGLILLSGYSYYDVNKLVNQKNDELEIINWIKNKVPHGAALFTFSITGAVNHYSDLHAKEFHNYKYHEIKKAMDSSNVITYFVLPTERINSQWKGLPIQKNLDSLQKEFNFKPIGSIKDFEGFIIEK